MIILGSPEIYEIGHVIKGMISDGNGILHQTAAKVIRKATLKEYLNQDDINKSLYCYNPDDKFYEVLIG